MIVIEQYITKHKLCFNDYVELCDILLTMKLIITMSITTILGVWAVVTLFSLPLFVV